MENMRNINLHSELDYDSAKDENVIELYESDVKEYLSELWDAAKAPRRTTRRQRAAYARLKAKDI
jgi:hypothetical protein